jgi:hypothetical protein
MQAPAQKQQLALAGPSAGSAAKTMRDLSGARPSDIVIDVIVAYTKKAAHGYADIERELVALAIEESNRSFRLSIGRPQALRARLGGSGDHIGPFPPRPKHMQSKTYMRLTRLTRSYGGAPRWDWRAILSA